MRYFSIILLSIAVTGDSLAQQESDTVKKSDAEESFNQQIGKVPAPETKQVAVATRKINRLFSKELSQREPKALQETINTLIQTGLDETDVVVQFALFQLAHKAAVDLCEPEMANQAATLLDQRFELDVFEIHLVALKKLARNARSPEKLRRVLQTYERIVEQAAVANHFTAAISLTEGMNAAARKLRESGISDQIKQTKDYLLFSKKIYDRWQESVDGQADSDDVEFNRGLFLFFVKRQHEGLSLIAKKQQTQIGQLASDELAQPDDQKKVEIAKGWLSWAAGLSAKARFEGRVARSHAASMLEEVIPRLKGLEKKEVENIVAKLGSQEDRPGGGISSHSRGRWSMDWQSHTDWDSVEVFKGKVIISIDGKQDVCESKIESGAIAFKMTHPHRVYYLMIEDGQLEGQIVDQRDGRVVNKGKGTPFK